MAAFQSDAAGESAATELSAGIDDKAQPLKQPEVLMQSQPNKQTKVQKQRIEMPQPPYPIISWFVLLCYILVGIEGAYVICKHPWSTELSLNGAEIDTASFSRVKTAQIHLCAIYLFELLLALIPGWCAMSPGWTCFELLVHHAPYVAALCIAFSGDHAYRWTAPMAMVLCTPWNEGLFIATALGAPSWLHKARRLYGFTGITALWLTETSVLVRNQFVHWQTGSDAIVPAITDQIVWGGIYYHALLLRLYIRRWMKTRTL
eukprot:TRINITY_DN6557_c0_g2_i1.p1 TRINITY_DN6557_c0_g2~~TRINITY_DN6557_c0_g2_i1.p1  ORF type:complete len:282 (+),score=51.70 TRINITY_DN6557_c0_g2_i1:66-848(+)